MAQGCRSLIIESPTGSGKTALTAMMIKTAAARGIQSWFVMHRNELIRQSAITFEKSGIEFGIIAAGYTPRKSARVQLCSVNTLIRRMSRLPAPGLIVSDECHHAVSKGWGSIFSEFPRAFHVGLTATPARLDGRGLGEHFQKIIHGPSVRWLIDNGYLSDYRIYAPKGVVADGIPIRMGDYAREALAEAADVPTITGNAVREYQRLTPGRRAIVRGVNIKHSKRIALAFNDAGIPARHVDGETPKAERIAAMESFVRGDTKVLSNVDLFSEGVDVPAVEAVLDLRPTQSLTLWLQFCGRALRLAPGKEYATIIDMAGNLSGRGNHGFPCDKREWSLDSKRKRRSGSGDTGPAVILCPECSGAQFGRPDKCRYCGAELVTGDGRKINEVEGELIEVNIEAERQRRELKMRIGRARTLPELQLLGKQLGHKPGWAWHLFNARRGKP